MSSALRLLLPWLAAHSAGRLQSQLTVQVGSSLLQWLQSTTDALDAPSRSLSLDTRHSRYSSYSRSHLHLHPPGPPGSRLVKFPRGVKKMLFYLQGQKMGSSSVSSRPSRPRADWRVGMLAARICSCTYHHINLSHHQHFHPSIQLNMTTSRRGRATVASIVLAVVAGECSAFTAVPRQPAAPMGCPAARTSPSATALSASIDTAAESIGNRHGQGSCFMPLLQNDEEYIAPRIVQVRCPGVTRSPLGS